GGVHKASSIKVAEAAKVIENAQRDLNIAFVNELSLIFDKIGVNTYEVLEAAKTKWNFLPFTPGLVGGHCIGVDPYYLTYKAAKLGYNANVLLAGRHTNDNMGRYAGAKILQHILLHNGNVKPAKVLVLGASFKENVADARNSKVIDMVSLLQAYKITVDVHDPVVSAAEIKKEYNIELKNEVDDNYDAVVIAVPHKAFRQLDENYFCSITKPHGLIADLKGLYRGTIKERAYWSF
ncbi:MAG TPA: nucleotide sugar dehydrogenase, partial [Chitinophagaceae bacterium]|nr:nucleotide sugar dehydrogenase [Chitinophagaceae bacterium]